MPTFQTMIGERPLIIETGKLAAQANGEVTVRYGDTVVLATVCLSAEPREGIDFFPLTVDYEERLYAAGKIPGGFFKREGRPSQGAVLTSRLTDRPLRPLFPKGLHNEVQVVITVLSADQENEPDTLAIVGASAALVISDIPFAGPVGAVRVGYINGELVLNPTFTQLTQSDLNLIVAGTKRAIIMVEGGGKEVAEDVVLRAIEFGQEANQEIIRLQEGLIQACGKPKIEVKARKTSPETEGAVASILSRKLAGGTSWKNRAEREAALADVEDEVREELGETQEVLSAFDSALKAKVRADILKQGVRPDGRRWTDIRPISIEVGTLPRTHGSGLFSRGGTQVLTIATLGSPGEEQIIDSIGQEESKRFMHHYNFPPFSTGEVKRLGSPGRREIGHGALAERALLPVIPSEEDFPYTIRLVSEVLSSNGSTSMASACGCTLSLMDAGVPIKAPVAGVAMGLITGDEGKYAILTDIEGLEDHLGDMDFKVAGTARGITALQMDTKAEVMASEIMKQALSQARQARLFILDRIKETISSSRPELSKYAPRMTKITIDPDKIRNVIGPGGRVIRSIIEETKATIEVKNDGTILIGSTSEEAAQKAIKIITDLTRDVEVGSVYTGKVTRLTNFGAFVEILPGKEGLVHLSELADYPAPSVEDVVKIGDEVMVIVTEIDRLGRVNLSRRAVFQKSSQTPGARVDISRAPASPPRRRQGPRPTPRFPEDRPAPRQGERPKPPFARG